MSRKIYLIVHWLQSNRGRVCISLHFIYKNDDIYSTFVRAWARKVAFFVRTIKKGKWDHSMRILKQYRICIPSVLVLFEFLNCQLKQTMHWIDGNDGKMQVEWESGRKNRMPYHIQLRTLNNPPIQTKMEETEKERSNRNTKYESNWKQTKMNSLLVRTLRALHRVNK